MKKEGVPPGETVGEGLDGRLTIGVEGTPTVTPSGAKTQTFTFEWSEDVMTGGTGVRRRRGQA